MISYIIVMGCYSSAEPHTKDIDVFLKRDIETGFGFRVLGGEGPQQPVSIYNTLVCIFKAFLFSLRKDYTIKRAIDMERQK